MTLRRGMDSNHDAAFPPPSTQSPNKDPAKLEALLKTGAISRRQRIREDEKLAGLLKAPLNGGGVAAAASSVYRCRARLPRGPSPSAGSSRVPSDAGVAPPLLSRQARVCSSLPESIGDKEVARRNRINDTVDQLRRVVPGFAGQSVVDKADVYEVTAKYILFMKRTVGNRFDKDFLRDFMPY